MSHILAQHMRDNVTRSRYGDRVLEKCCFIPCLYQCCKRAAAGAALLFWEAVLSSCPLANYIQSATLEEVAAGKAGVFCLAAALSCPSFTDSRMPPSQLTEPLSQMSDSAACRSYSSCHITSLINSSLSVHMQSTKLMNHTFKREFHQPLATIT